MAIILEQVSKYYGKQKALDNINLILEEGEICGFLGPNGAGKSTTMKIITGYLTDFEGNVQINGLDIRQQAIEAKTKIGYLPEHNPLYPDMYIREYLLHVAHLYHLSNAKKKVEEIIELTGLMPEVRKKIGQLSKGYRQRVGLAQVLVHEPEVLILDEPMTGLDPNQLEEIRELIIRVGKNKTVLLSTHIMQEVEAICERVIIINQGQIVTDKNIQDIRNLSGQEMVLSVTFAPDSPLEWFSASPLFQNVRQLATDTWQATALPGQDPRIELFQQAAIHHCPIIELKKEEHHLEEVFHLLTQQK